MTTKTAHTQEADAVVTDTAVVATAADVTADTDAETADVMDAVMVADAITMTVSAVVTETDAMTIRVTTEAQNASSSRQNFQQCLSKTA